MSDIELVLHVYIFRTNCLNDVVVRGRQMYPYLPGHAHELRLATCTSLCQMTGRVFRRRQTRFPFPSKHPRNVTARPQGARCDVLERRTAPGTRSAQGSFAGGPIKIVPSGYDHRRDSFVLRVSSHCSAQLLSVITSRRASRARGMGCVPRTVSLMIKERDSVQ